jgi:acyl homoserine lactone synthase
MKENNSTLCIISPQCREQYGQELEQYFILRKEVLIDQRGWDLKSVGNKEIDQFDHEYAHYLLYKDLKTGKVMGGVRLTPSLAPNLTMDIFAHLIDSELGFCTNPLVWESSRYVTASVDKTSQRGLVRNITLQLFIGMIEYCLRMNVYALLTLTEVRLERIGRMVGWPLRRLGRVEYLGDTHAVVGLVETNEIIKRQLRAHGKLHQQILPPNQDFS